MDWNKSSKNPKNFPTPRASDFKGATTMSDCTMKRVANGQANLPEMVQELRRKEMYPTPRAANPGSRPNGKGGKILAEEVLIKEGLRMRGEKLHGGTKTQQTYPTPRCFMHKDALQDRGKSNLGEVINGMENMTVSGQLNPEWVEWLMGWTIGWTDLNPLEMVKFRQWLNSHGKS
jgi:hypothetical protein